jgi:hypothetical protein
MNDDDPIVSPGGNDGNGNGQAPNGRFLPGHGFGRRFEKGNRLGRGNPQAIRMHEHRMQFLEAIHEGTIPALAKKLQVAALEGDEFATKMVLDYALGRPQQAVELSGPDGSPLGVNIGQMTMIIMNALAGPEYAEARVRIAADLMRLDDARDDHAAADA